MSIVKSFSVGDGDMFYIKHNSDNFTIIDCCIKKDSEKTIVEELIRKSKDKNVRRFISTHPDDDHIRGLKLLNSKSPIVNFYCVKNEATKTDQSNDFDEYCELRDSSKACYLEKGLERAWLNKEDNEGERGSSGIFISWPIVSNVSYNEALNQAKEGKDPNNISPIINYKLKQGASILWFGDLRKEFLEKIEPELTLPKADIIFAPHHGRDSGKIYESLLNKIGPQIIVLGEAPSGDLNYYGARNTIKQNSAGDIVFVCEKGCVHIFVSNENYTEDFLEDEGQELEGYCYLGTLNL